MKKTIAMSIKKIALLVSIFMFTLVCFAGINTPNSFTADAQSEDVSEARVYDKATGMEYTPIGANDGEKIMRDVRFRQEYRIEQDFCDQTVIVTLKHAHSVPNNMLRSQDFATRTAFDSVEDLTYFTEEGEAFWKAESGGLDLSNFNQILSLRLRERGKENVLRAIKELEQTDKVLAAEPNFNSKPMANANRGLWGLDRIETTAAQNIATGHGAGVTVGVMESDGILAHTQLGNRLLTGNIATPVMPNNPTQQQISTIAHGVHVAGIIAGATTGVAPSASIMPLSGNWSDFVSSLTFARNKGVSIVNASFRYTETINNIRLSQGPQTAHFNAIQDFPGLFVGAAGNINWNNDTPRDNNIADSGPQFPASYRLPNVISVGASKRTRSTIFHSWRDERASFSNFGATTVDIFAPGTGIRSSIHNNGYANWDGTSFAAPMVTGMQK